MLLFVVGQVAQSQTKTISNTRGDYEVTIPRKWKSRDNGQALRVEAPYRRKDGGQTGLNISTASAMGMNVEECYDEFIIKGFPDAFEDLKFVESSEMEIQGLKAKSVICTYREELALQSQITILVKDDILYMFIGITTPKVFDEYVEAFTEISKSIRFLK